VSGGGRVVAVVDAYGYPGAASDLAVYRSAMKLSACSSGDGCLRIVNQQGQAGNLPPANVEWDGEQALDLDMISAICPKCTIVLVQANSSRFRDLGAAVDTAVALGAVSVSNSYGGNEWSADDRMFDHPGHVITASSGDTGAGVEQPCSFAGVVCVGGTSLTNATNARGWNEVAWADGISNGTGSGCSKRVAKPVWQTDKGCTNRSEADISAVADPYTGVAVFESAGGGWRQFGGTSVSSPIVAAMFALAGNTAAIDAPQWIWQHGGTAAFNDVVFGSNPGRFRCPSNMLYICEAGPGYDGPTGWGTPSGLSGL
jgi:subtilase family serine protease